MTPNSRKLCLMLMEGLKAEDNAPVVAVVVVAAVVFVGTPLAAYQA